jgi:hypothetical protein
MDWINALSSDFSEFFFKRQTVMNLSWRENTMRQKRELFIERVSKAAKLKKNHIGSDTIILLNQAIYSSFISHFSL